MFSLLGKDKGHQLSDKDGEFVGKRGHIWNTLT